MKGVYSYCVVFLFLQPQSKTHGFNDPSSADVKAERRYRDRSASIKSRTGETELTAQHRPQCNQTKPCIGTEERIREQLSDAEGLCQDLP